MLHLPGAASNIFIADDDIANVQIQPEQPQYIYITAKKPGKTVLYAVDKAGRVLLNKIIEVPLVPVTIIRGAKIDTGEPEQSPLIVLPLQPAPTPPAAP
jgi:Flp pilus assembly secretin CpaC